MRSSLSRGRRLYEGTPACFHLVTGTGWLLRTSIVSHRDFTQGILVFILIYNLSLGQVS